MGLQKNTYTSFSHAFIYNHTFHGRFAHKRLYNRQEISTHGVAFPVLKLNDYTDTFMEGKKSEYN
jgi:hypothetical protein